MASLGDLTLAQRSEAQKVESSYAKWWGSVRFRKGWSTPPVSFEEMRPILAKAAEVVVRVRSVLDESDPSFKMRRVEGCSYAYFADLTPSHLSDPMAVVSGVVKATFMDGTGGYTEGLSEEALEAYITLCAQNWESQGAALPKPSSPPALPGLKAEFTRKLAATMLALNELPDDEGMIESLREALGYLERGQSILESLSSQTPTQPHQQPAQQVTQDLEVVEMSDSDTDSKRASSPSPSPAADLEEASASGQESDQPAPESGCRVSDEGSEGEEEEEWEKCGEVDDVEMTVEDVEEESPEPSEPAEPSPEEIEAKQEFDGKLQRVKEEVERLARAEAAVKETWSSLDKNTWGAHKEAGRVHRQCLQISEELMKAMLSLDQLSSPCPESRQERKQQVVAIQRQLDSMDATTDQIKVEVDSLEEVHQAAVDAKRDEFTSLCKRMEEGDFEGMPQVDPELELGQSSQAYSVKCHLEGWPEGTVAASVSSVNSHNDTMVVKGKYYPSKQLLKEIEQKGVAKIQSGEEAALTCSPAELVDRVAGARFGAFAKSFTLPEDALWKQGTIKFTKGRLLLSIPKSLGPWEGLGGMRWL